MLHRGVEATIDVMTRGAMMRRLIHNLWGIVQWVVVTGLVTAGMIWVADRVPAFDAAWTGALRWLWGY